MVVDDFIDEFYAFDINNWAESLVNVLCMLNFPVRLEYTCKWREFLYERSDRLRYFGTDDRRLLAECQEIAMLSMSRRFRNIKMLSVMLSGNKHLRNEKVYDIYKLFRKIYGRHTLFVVCFDRDIAFLGTTVDKWKRSEVIISDWFGEETNLEVMRRILEIDFSSFSHKNLEEFYGDYLWAIARPYIRYQESIMYLIYECGFVETYESFAIDSDGESVIPIIKIDREETLRVNSEYYTEQYGDDYFVDESLIEDDTLDILDEDEAEFEWTMLEMELAKEEIEEDDEYEDDYEFKDEEYSTNFEEEYDDISGMNPEEMLLYIQKGND